MAVVLWSGLGRPAPLESRFAALCLVGSMGMGTGMSLLCPVALEVLDHGVGDLCPQQALGGDSARLVLGREAGQGFLEFPYRGVATRVASGL